MRCLIYQSLFQTEELIEVMGNLDLSLRFYRSPFQVDMRKKSLLSAWKLSIIFRLNNNVANPNLITSL